MNKGIFITGSGTGVGKTLCASILLKILRDDGIDAVPMKPIQCGLNASLDGKTTTDLDFVLEMNGLVASPEEIELMNPCLYKSACSPHLAAEIEKRPVEISKIKDAVSKLLEEHQLVLAEGAGGALVPLDD